MKAMLGRPQRRSTRRARRVSAVTRAAKREIVAGSTNARTGRKIVVRSPRLRQTTTTTRMMTVANRSVLSVGHLKRLKIRADGGSVDAQCRLASAMLALDK